MKRYGNSKKDVIVENLNLRNSLGIQNQEKKSDVILEIEKNVQSLIWTKMTEWV